MKIKRFYILIIGLVVFVTCDNKGTGQIESNPLELTEAHEKLIRINYDYENLGLNLNASITDPSSKIEWRWDYMNSDNRMPDSTGIDHYMNISQPVFSFNEETTLPSLFIKTDKNKIIEFSVTIIFHLPKTDKRTLESLMDQLTTFDLFNEESIRTEIINNGEYQKKRELFEEKITLSLRKEEYGYDRMVYWIKNVED